MHLNIMRRPLCSSTSNELRSTTWRGNLLTYTKETSSVTYSENELENTQERRTSTYKTVNIRCPQGPGGRSLTAEEMCVLQSEMNPSPPFDSDLLRLSLGGEFFAIRQTFPFLKLPAELRNHVYRHLLDRATRAPPVDDMEHHRWLAPYSPMERPGLETSILATSRQVHDEAAHILYGCQLFHTNASSCAATHYSSKCDEALELLAPEYLQRITRVSIDIYYRVPVTSMGRLMNSHLKFRAHIAQICVLLAQCTLVEVRVNEHYSHMCSWGQANQEVLGWILENRHLKLEPFKALQNVGKVIFGGDVNPEYARELKETMEGEVTPEGQTMAQRNSQERGLQSYPNHQQLID